MTIRWRRPTRQLLLILHYISSVGWLGVGLCQFTLNLVALSTGEALMRHHVWEIAHILDRWLLTPLALGAATTGILLGWRSNWGLVKHWWIVTKLILTVALLLFAPVWLGGWVTEAITATAYINPDHGYPAIRAQLLGGSVGMATTLTVIVVVSVLKPWGRTRRR